MFIRLMLIHLMLIRALSMAPTATADRHGLGRSMPTAVSELT